MKVSDTLIEIKSLIDTPEKWTKRAYSRDKDGNTVDYLSTDATCFCILGAAKNVFEKNEEKHVMRHSTLCHIKSAIVTVMDVSYTHYEWIDNFNDALIVHHSDIMNVMNYAIERAKENDN